MRLILISDTHGFEPEVPDGDILIHAGDLTMSGTTSQVSAAGAWLQMLPHKYKVVIAGNHDWLFERDKISAINRLGKEIIYLENEGVTIEGLKIYGSPVQPRFFDWAFNVDRGVAIKKYWDQIPENSDVLITHGPPRMILDQASAARNTDHCGCDDLWDAVRRTTPKIHVFGHIHGGYGTMQFGKTVCYNASVVNEAYQVKNKPWVIDL